MRIIIAFIAGLAVVTFPVYFVVFVFKAIVMGIFAFMASVLWLFGQLFMKLNVFSSNRTKEQKLLRR
jgi:hypothetical protein